MRKGEEIGKCMREEMERSSLEFIKIDKTIDRKEFEDATNRIFNKKFDRDLLKSKLKAI